MRRVALAVVVLLLVPSCAPVNTANVKLEPPFKLTPDEEKNVDRLLARWEQWNAGVKTFDCGFKRWVYDAVFGNPDEPKYVDLGTIKYAAPDHARFRVEKTEKDGNICLIEDTRAEDWAFDGKSIIECNHVRRQVIEHQVAAGVQGTKLVDGPLSFAFPAGQFSSVLGVPACPYPFSASAKALKEQFYLREVAAPADRHDEIRLEAYPRSARLATAFQKLCLIFRASDMSPVAMKIVQRNGKDSVIYQFYDIAVNSPPPSSGDNPFHPARPLGWRTMVEEPPAALVEGAANDSRR
jgi:TIGR03009 family protein